jgi:hypothetical protein
VAGAGVAVATLAVMAGCSTGTPAPDRAASRGGRGRHHGGAPAGRRHPASGAIGPAGGRPDRVCGSYPGSLFLARLDPTTLQPLAGPRVKLEVNLVGWSVSPDRSLAVIGDGNGNGLVPGGSSWGPWRSLGTVQIGIGASTDASAWLGPAAGGGRVR